MKYSTLASPSLVLYTIFSPTVGLMIPLTVCICSNRISSIFWVVSVHLWLNMMLFLTFHSAFTLVTYSQDGIKNKYLSLSFDDIKYATILDTELNKYIPGLKINIPLICLGTTINESSFFTHSKRSCILLPYTSKVLRQLEDCLGDRDPEWFSFLKFWKKYQ